MMLLLTPAQWALVRADCPAWSPETVFAVGLVVTSPLTPAA